MKELGRTQKSINNIAFGMLNRIVLMLMPFAIKTIMIKKLGAEYLGLNNLFSSILQVLSLSELGIGTAMVYSMYKPMAENNKKELCALLNLYKKFYEIIGCIILVCGLILMPFLDKLISGSYPEELNLYWLYIIYLLNTVLSYFLFAYKKSLLEASQQNSVESKINTIVSCGMYFFQIIALILTNNYYIYAIFMPISTIFLNIFRNVIVNKMFPEITCKGEMDKEFIKGLYKKVSALIGHRIGTTVITSADSIIISAFLGLHVLAVYGNYYYILSSLISLVTIFYTATTSSIGNSLIIENKEKNYKDFNTFTFMNIWLVGWFSICLLCLYQPFMKMWMGEELMFPMHTVILFVVYFYAWLSRRIGLTYKDAAGLWSEDFWKPYVGVIVNIIGSVLLVIYIGVEGVIIATIIVMVLIYFPWETKVIFSKLFPFNARNYYLRYYFYTAVTILGGGITYLVVTKVEIEGILGFLLKVIICMFIPNLIYIISYHRFGEFNDVLRRVKAFIVRR